MHIALIGMSGIGKSYWSQRLQEVGFKYFGCDLIITRKLSQEIDSSLKTFDDLLQWFGLPIERDYELRASKYLSLESLTLQEIVTTLVSNRNLEKKNIVIDTSGSAIYAEPGIWDKFRQQVKVIHLGTPSEVQSIMFGEYLKNPRPLIWNGIFQHKPGEHLKTTYRRCYPVLLQQREKLYEKYSDKRIDYQEHRHPHLTTEQFLQLIIS